MINKLKNEPFNLEEYIQELLKDISPLMILNQGTNANVSSFILNTEKLFGFILDNKLDGIDKIREYVQERAENILQKDNLNEISNKREEILRVLDDGFWEDITFEDVDFMVRDLAPLMKYFEPERRKLVIIDDHDRVISRSEYVKEIKEDEELKALLDRNEIVRKIRKGKCITSGELLELEREFSSLRPELSIENIQKYHKKDFLLLLKKVFAERKHIEIEDFTVSPLADENPLYIFEPDELRDLVDKCNQIKMC
ncbi:MAG: hypothetical protein PQ975_11770 [Methanobacterium sp.]|jgi:type I restriction enzyme R subunit